MSMQVFGPMLGFKVLQGPPKCPKRLNLYLSPAGIEHNYMQGVQRKKDFYPLEQVSATAEPGRLILSLGEERYVLEADHPERYIEQLEAVRASCVVCGERSAPLTCSQCGRKVCRHHANAFRGETYCIRCKIVCPRCNSDQISAQKQGFKLGRAVAGTIVGGLVLGGLLGAIGSGNVELVCMTCGHCWRPKI